MSELVLLHHNEPMTTSLAIAEGVDVQHKNVVALIRKHVGDLENFGEIAFQTRLNEHGRPTEFGWLNEGQSMFLMTLMRNSPIVVRFKLALVQAFLELRDRAAVPPAPTFAPMDHGADILASADRTFRAMLRSCRAVGLRLPQAIGRANEATRRRTGVDILAEIDADEMVAAMSTRHSPTKELPLDDPLRPMVLEWMDTHPEIGEIRSEDLVRAILANVSDRQMRSAQMRLSVILRDLGWTKRKVGGSGPNLWVRPLEVAA
jgi:phage regulator Rha-like protein